MTRHPGKTQAQRRVLDAIGCGNLAPIMAKSTKKALLDAGLIVKCGEKLFGSPPLQVVVDEFCMPVPVHMQWCEAQSEEATRPRHQSPLALR